MKTLFNKIWNWLCAHHDLAHLIGGFGFGLAFGFLASVAAAITAEAKDKQWRGKPTWKDVLITVGGGAIGGVLHYLVFKRI